MRHLAGEPAADKTELIMIGKSNRVTLTIPVDKDGRQCRLSSPVRICRQFLPKVSTMPNRLFSRKKDVSDAGSDSAESGASSVDSGLPKKKKHGRFNFRNPFARKKSASDAESIEDGGMSDGVVSDVSADDVKKNKRFRFPFSTKQKKRGNGSSSLPSISSSISLGGKDKDEAASNSDEAKKKKVFRFPFTTMRKQRADGSGSLPSGSPFITSEDEEENEAKPTSVVVDSDDSSRKISLFRRLFPRWRDIGDGMQARHLSPFELLFLRLVHPELFEEEAEMGAQMPQDRMIEEDLESEKKQMERDLVLEVDNYEDLRPVVEPLIQDPEAKARVAVALHAIRQNADIRSDVSQRLLRALGELPREDADEEVHRRRTLAMEEQDGTMRYPPNPDSRKQFFDPNAN